MNSVSKWLKSGQPWIWLNAGAVSISLLMVIGLVLLIAVRGLAYFWPADVMQADYMHKGNLNKVLGEITESEDLSMERLRDSGYQIGPEIASHKKHIVRYLVKMGNRDVTGTDFKVLLKPMLKKVSYPDNVMVVERREWGNFYGFLKALKKDGKILAEGEEAQRILDQHLKQALGIFDEISDIRKHDIGKINYNMERLRLRERRLELDGDTDPAKQAAIAADRKVLDEQYKHLQAKLSLLSDKIRRDSLVVETVDGKRIEINMGKVVRAYFPNAMSTVEKVGLYFAKLWEFVSDDPREANTEGGIFPAIFGTVLMVMLMALLVTPFGVVAAVYLREYARQGLVIRLIRIAVNNLAGVPSIVYGIFGLGFFVYFLGGNIDALFFPEARPAPVFGTPGILWSSLTLALLTLPVVIVATEEGLSRIPRSIREGSLALGATKAETLWRTVLPMASPAMMTGLILAVARAAGEVAPLMLVGVVKMAPSLPLDGNFPFLHMERKFMHLGFHIYDVGFQSPNVEAARPLVYATSLLLIIVIVLLNLTAIRIRNRLRENYRMLEN
ncbi:Phosphate transport system permease protein PstA (TC 3.A.1.7.1) [hydrothermal vent metagenome]|uniref:Phosphate transport system permease protein PstA (TC 3.A.1.7.1) n=1 Tax=hydrothermal vent metagenome TaxID=652676 RepID=A0A3B1BJN8_9ZZZZ